MNHTVGCLLVLYFILANVKEAFGQTKPFNVVAEFGGGGIFNCTGTAFRPNWFMSKDGSSNTQSIAGSCVVTPGFENHYGTDPTGGPTVCNLIVFNATTEQAGVYWCSNGVTPSSYALLTVIDKNPDITYNNTPIVKEGDDVVIACALNYSGSVIPAPTLNPHFYWTDHTGGNVSSFKEISSENSSVVSELVVTARRQDIMPYTCHVYLELVPKTSPAFANNTPSVNSGASSSTITVLYSPEITSITSTVSTTDKCVYKQESLTCAASANPQAEYEWMDLDNNSTSNGSVLLIKSGGQFQCTASNLIVSQRYSDTNITSEATCYSPYNLTITGSNCPNNSCSCNGGNQSSVALSCMASGFPVPTFQWWSDVPGMEDLGSNPTINVDIDGNYSCTASNVYGSQTHTATASILITNCLQPGPMDTTVEN